VSATWQPHANQTSHTRAQPLQEMRHFHLAQTHKLANSHILSPTSHPERSPPRTPSRSTKLSPCTHQYDIKTEVLFTIVKLSLGSGELSPEIMAAYATMGCCDTYRSVRPNIRRAVTAPSTSPKKAETPQAKQALVNHIPTPLTPRIIKDHSPSQEPTILNECALPADGSFHPLAGSITTPSAWNPQLEDALEPELRLSAVTAGTKPVLQSGPILSDMVTLNRNAYPALKDLGKHLATHDLFHTHVDPNAVTVLCINDLCPSEYHELYSLLASQLEGFRIKIDFHDTTLILRRPSPTHESGVGGWGYVGNLLQTQMRMPSRLKRNIYWQRGQPDITLPPLSIGGLRIKCPDACLGSADEKVPTLVLETGYSQTPGEVHMVAKTWLWRLIKDGTEALEDHAVQCVIVFKVNENLTKEWLPAFRQSFERHGFILNRDRAPDPTSFVSKAALQSIALTVEIWRNEQDGTGALKREPSVRNRPTCTIPVCISTHNITTEQLFDTWIWEYLSDVRDGTDTIFHPLQEYPPIPRPTVSPDQQNKYFTLYSDDLTSPKDIPDHLRGKVWINVPVKVWVWGYLLSQQVGFKGWQKEVVARFKDDWAQLETENKENRNPTIDMKNDGRVLGDLEAENDQTRVKRRKVQKGL